MKCIVSVSHDSYHMSITYQQAWTRNKLFLQTLLVLKTLVRVKIVMTSTFKPSKFKSRTTPRPTSRNQIVHWTRGVFFGEGSEDFPNSHLREICTYLKDTWSGDYQTSVAIIYYQARSTKKKVQANFKGCHTSGDQVGITRGGLLVEALYVPSFLHVIIKCYFIFIHMLYTWFTYVFRSMVLLSQTWVSNEHLTERLCLRDH